METATSYYVRTAVIIITRIREAIIYYCVCCNFYIPEFLRHGTYSANYSSDQLRSIILRQFEHCSIESDVTLVATI